MSPTDPVVVGLFLIGCVVVCAFYYGAEWQAREEYRQEQQFEREAYAYERRMQLQARYRPEPVEPIKPSTDIIPEDRRHVSTTVNYETGEITEKWKAQ